MKNVKKYKWVKMRVPSFSPKSNFEIPKNFPHRLFPPLRWLLPQVGSHRYRRCYLSPSIVIRLFLLIYGSSSCLLPRLLIIADAAQCTHASFGKLWFHHPLSFQLISTHWVLQDFFFFFYFQIWTKFSYLFFLLFKIWTKFS